MFKLNFKSWFKQFGSIAKFCITFTAIFIFMATVYGGYTFVANKSALENEVSTQKKYREEAGIVNIYESQKKQDDVIKTIMDKLDCKADKKDVERIVTNQNRVENSLNRVEGKLDVLLQDRNKSALDDRKRILSVNN